jgi:oxygen-independent coproporphyrinogen-3 oxidase
MNLLYIHIPFCKSKCIYCDFFSSVDQHFKERYIACICEEIHQKQKYIYDNKLDTIYFGGGTPSILTEDDFRLIFNEIDNNFVVKKESEITIECNPEGINSNYVSVLKKFPFNRISIGIQSFNNSELRFLNRIHTAEKAKVAIELLKNKGFNNISIDLMYSLPGQTPESWQYSINEAINLNIQHISAYSLTYEETTKLNLLRQKGDVIPTTDETSNKFFKILINRLLKSNFEHYEISNFCQKGFYSKHNLGYWQRANYIGIGASAHSFNGISRQWNIANIEKYCQNIENNVFYYEKEILTPNNKYNELIFLSLRMGNGINLIEVENFFGKNRLNYLLECADKHLKNRVINVENNHLKLTQRGIFISDLIIRDLII